MNRRYRGFLTTFALIVLLQSSPASRAQDGCLTCHQTMEDPRAALFLKDVHRAKGFSCADCHGGNRNAEDMETAMDPDAGFRGVPAGDEITEMCSSCHSDGSAMVKTYNSILPWGQKALLEASVHNRLASNGKERIVNCVTCHNAHGIVPVEDPASPVYPLNVTKTCGKCHSDASYMRIYNPTIAVDQVDKYRTSVHGMKNAAGDRKVAECASCHGSHEIRSAKDVKSKVYPTNVPETCSSCHSNPGYMAGYGIESDQFEKYSNSVHGKALLEKNDIGAPACNDCHGNHAATPPGVASVSNVCGTCHALNADLFAKSPHKEAFDEADLPECETCHGNHEIVAASERLLGVSDEAVCSWCHGGDPDSRGYRTAASMRLLADSMDRAESRAIGLVEDAEQKGMEISDAKFKLRDARQAILQSRTMVHSFDEERFREVITAGIAVTAVASSEANEAIDEYYFRRWGLVFATSMMILLSISLYVYIRKLEKRKEAARRNSAG